MKVGAEIRIKGRVQGVGFRYYCYQRARSLGVTGWVRNNPDGTVSARAEGDKQDVDSFIDEVKNGPRPAVVSDVDVDWRDFSGQYTHFDIAH